MTAENCTSNPKLSEIPTETLDVLLQLIRLLVDYPNEAKINVLAARQVTILEVTVHKEDVRRLIGRKGRTADALRVILVNLGAKTGRRYIMEIMEPNHQMTEIPPTASSFRVQP